MHAFRCKNCGHLHPAEHAGERHLPAKCSACGEGVTFDKKGNQTYHPEIWEVLADATPERHTELGIDSAEVAKHIPDASKVRAGNLERSKEALAQLVTKKAKWDSSRDAIVKEVWALEDKLKALTDQDSALDAAEGPLDRQPDEVAKLHDEIASTKSKIVDLVNCEWTERDKAHVAELEAAVARQGHPPARGGRTHYNRHGKDSAFARNLAGIK